MNYQPLLETPAWDGADETKPAFNVAVVYDSRRAATRAMNVIGGLLHQLGDDFEFHCNLWRFDVLELPEAREGAARAGAAADLLIISARCDNGLPLSVKAWLDQCLAGKIPGSAALVGLLESRRQPIDLQCRARQFLQQAADRSLLDFFLHEVDLPNTSLGMTVEDLQTRANSVTSVLDGILHRSASAPRRWTQE